MKKLLLVLPYIVAYASFTAPGETGKMEKVETWQIIRQGLIVNSVGNKEFAEDMAYILNQAAQNRVLYEEWNPPKGVPDQFKDTEYVPTRRSK